MILVIPSAGLATRMQPLSFGTPKVLVSHHDRPLIDHILASYRSIKLKKVIVVISPGQQSLFDAILAAYHLQYSIELVVQAEPKGLLDAVLTALKTVTTPDSVVVHLADAIFKRPFAPTDFQKSFITLTKVAANEVKHWCMVDVKKESVCSFDDKPFRSKWRAAITGVYYFSHYQVLKTAVNTIKVDSEALKKGEISALLDLYTKNDPLYAYYRDDWCDMGTLHHMHQDLFQHMQDGHRVMQFDQFIYKSGTSTAVKNEAFYYKHCLVPACFPRIHEITKEQITMDYVSGHSLAYYFLWLPLNKETGRYITDSLWYWLESNFYHLLPPAPQHDYRAQTFSMYGKRVIDRVELWRKQLPIKDARALFQEYISINGCTIKGWDLVREYIQRRAQNLAKTAKITHIHGDLHCRNILYNPEQNKFCLLDPRGAWGNKQSIWGDIRYEAAKFLHSFHGGYEFIKNRLSRYEELSDGGYILQIPLINLDQAQWLDHFCLHWRVKKEDVLWIEALCLLSISKFYQDPALQKQFFLQGLILLNSLL